MPVTAGGGQSAAIGNLAPINGLDLYFEVHGTGRPLVLVHGGLLTIDLTFGRLIPALAEGHQVIGVELQGHGHTVDIDRPMSLEDLAGDVASLLDHLAIEEADFLGFKSWRHGRDRPCIQTTRPGGQAGDRLGRPSTWPR